MLILTTLFPVLLTIACICQQIADLANEDTPQMYTLCGRGPRSTLRVLRHGLEVRTVTTRNTQTPPPPHVMDSRAAVTLISSIVFRRSRAVSRKGRMLMQSCTCRLHCRCCRHGGAGPKGESPLERGVPARRRGFALSCDYRYVMGVLGLCAVQKCFRFRCNLSMSVVFGFQNFSLGVFGKKKKKTKNHAPRLHCGAESFSDRYTLCISGL